MAVARSLPAGLIEQLEHLTCWAVLDWPYFDGLVAADHGSIPGLPHV